jgi:hypothetical protein
VVEGGKEGKQTGNRGGIVRQTEHGFVSSAATEKDMKLTIFLTAGTRVAKATRNNEHVQ